MLSSLGQTGLVAKILALALALTSWPQPRAFGLGLALVLLTWPQKMCYPMQNNIGCSHSWLYHCNLHYKDVVRHSNVGQKFIYTLLTLSPCVLIHKCLHVAGLDLSLSPQPRRLGLCLGLILVVWPQPQSFGLGLDVLASLTSLITIITTEA